MKKIIGLTVVMLFFSGCVSAPNKMQKLEVGMSKDDALKIMGKPDRTAANEKAQAFYYSHKAYGQWSADWYYVNIVDGKIESFGMMDRNQGDIDRQRAAAAYLIGRSSMTPPTVQPSAYQMPINKPINCTTNKMGTTAYTNCL